MTAQDLHQALLEALATSRAAEHRLAVLLLEMKEQRLYRQLGHPSMSAYARTCLEFGAFKLKALLKLAREAPTLPALEQAFASGELPWTKARLLLQVADPDTAADWVARATHISSRELERQVDSVCKGDKPPSPDAVDLAPPRRRRSFLMEATDAEVLDKTLALLRSQTSLRDQDIDDGRLLGLVIRRAAKALADEAEQAPSEPLHRTVITLCPDCATASHPDFQVMDHVVTQALDDSEVLDLTHGPDRGKLTRHIPERTRRAVLARDDYRCVFPGCTCHLFLDLHHLRPFAQGGDHSEANLVTVCTAHHAAAHEGHVGLFTDQGQLMAVHQGGVVEPARHRRQPRTAA